MKIKQTLNNELKFHIVDDDGVRCDENRQLYSDLIHVQPRRGTFSGVSGTIKTMHTGLSARTRIALCHQRPGADTEETGRYDLAWKDLCSVLNALSK